MNSLAQKQSIVNKLILVDFFLYALIVWSVLSDSSLTSSLFYISSAILFLMFIIQTNRIVNFTYVLLILICMISFIGVLLSGLKNDLGVSFSGLANYISFVSTLMFMYVISHIKVETHIIKSIINIGVVVAAFYPIGYVLFRFTTNVNLFTMNFSNPNLTGMFLLQSIYYCAIGFIVYSKLISKVLCLGIAAVDFYFMMETDARNCLIALFGFCFVLVFFKIKQKNQIPGWILALVTVSPLLFMWFYLSFFSLITNLPFIQNMEQEGKPLDSRIYIWNNILDGLRGSYLLGDYYGYGGNAHNSHLSILSGYGVIVLILSIVFIYNVIAQRNNETNSYKQSACIAAFCGTIFMGLGEGALFCGSIGLYIPACTFLLLAGYSFDDQSSGVKKHDKK